MTLIQEYINNHNYKYVYDKQVITETCLCISKHGGNSIKIQPFKEDIEILIIGSNQVKVSEKEKKEIRKTKEIEIRKEAEKTHQKIKNFSEYIRKYIDEIENSYSKIKLYIESNDKELDKFDKILISYPTFSTSIAEHFYCDFKPYFNFNMGIRLHKDLIKEYNLLISCDKIITKFEIEISNVTILTKEKSNLHDKQKYIF